jgi:hypothetical protein
MVLLLRRPLDFCLLKVSLTVVLMPGGISDFQGLAMDLGLMTRLDGLKSMLLIGCTLRLSLGASAILEFANYSKVTYAI